MGLVNLDNILVRRGAAELRDLGFKVFELREHGDTLRIVIGAREFAAISVETARAVSAKMKTLGYKYVALDLEPLEDTWHRS